MWKWVEKFDRKKVILSFLLLEAAVFAVYSIFVVTGYSSYPSIDYTDADMMLYTVDGDIQEGNYTDTSFAEVKTVVTPAFRLKNGIYHIQASIRGQGPVKGGLIYDQTVCGYRWLTPSASRSSWAWRDAPEGFPWAMLVENSDTGSQNFPPTRWSWE